jgi:hypothetical protein
VGASNDGRPGLAGRIRLFLAGPGRGAQLAEGARRRLRLHTVLAGFFHAGQGKPNVEGIVQTDNSAPSGFLVRLVAFYYS